MKWIAALALGVGITALSAMGWAAVTDLDGDGLYSLIEAQATYPDLTEDLFLSLDQDGDGYLSVEEVAAGEEAGVLIADS